MVIAFMAASCRVPESRLAQTADLREPAVRLANAWSIAAMNGDVERLRSMTDDPFFFDDTSPVAGDAISALFTSPEFRNLRVLPGQMTASTVEAYRESTRDDRINRAAGAMSLEPSDYVVDNGSFLLFVRFKGAQGKVVGYWD